MNLNIGNNMMPVGNFTPISIETLDSMELLNRYDIKFIMNNSALPEILSSLDKNYKILEINHCRIFHYLNQYFDTKDYLFYNQHHNGKQNRSKIRYRKYLETGTCFFEIKRRSNDSRTTKERMKAEQIPQFISGSEGNFVESELSIHPEGLFPKLQVSYSRITLLCPEILEKITIDTDIKFKNTINSIELPGLVLLEIKQKKICHTTPSVQLLKYLCCHPLKGLSKYCMGLVLTDNSVKYNRFKSKVLIINKLSVIENGFQFYNRFSYH